MAFPRDPLRLRLSYRLKPFFSSVSPYGVSVQPSGNSASILPLFSISLILQPSISIPFSRHCVQEVSILIVLPSESVKSVSG